MAENEGLCRRKWCREWKDARRGTHPCKVTYGLYHLRSSTWVVCGFGIAAFGGLRMTGAFRTGTDDARVNSKIRGNITCETSGANNRYFLNFGDVLHVDGSTRANTLSALIYQIRVNKYKFILFRFNMGLVLTLLINLSPLVVVCFLVLLFIMFTKCIISCLFHKM